ncbi:MAG: matrixin family metalloprotease [Bryobacteraceae bacterium]|nr:matrixin family metalloprotease [Bryobacteraceae bacterium]
MTRIAALATLAASLASGYYHFVYFPSRNGPFVPIPVKFDLASIPDRTVQYFISLDGPDPMAPGDSAAAIASQIRMAARTWNEVPSSELRIAFGGYRDTNQLQTTPGIDVVFDDEIPPGIIAQAGPITLASVDLNTSRFVPLLRSRLQLRRDLSTQPSYTESFFTVLVHEFGHTLGLQHTFTSGVMATPITQAATKARPLSGDDIAGLSLLYPTPQFLAGTGAISGRVTLNSAGVNLASVVAITPAGLAYSTLSNPDGTYRIEGLPPGNYLIYTHPVPPAAFGEVTPGNIVLPRDDRQEPFRFGQNFSAQFFPNTREWRQAAAVSVNAGQTVDLINFPVRQRATPAIHGVQSYGFLNRVAVKSPPARTEAQTTLYFTGNGLMANNQVAPGLRVEAIGDDVQAAANSVRVYVTNPPYIQADFAAGATTDGYRHLLFQLGDDMYVLPAAFFLVSRAAPVVSSVRMDQETVTITGSGFTTESRVIFDGIAGRIRKVTPEEIEVAAPAWTGGNEARVAVLNSDGQSSIQSLGSNVPPALAAAALSRAASVDVQPAAIPAGVDSVIEITGNGTNFVEGQTRVGFGSSDVAVRRVWVLSPSRLLVNVSVSAAAPSLSTAVTVVNGLDTIRQPNAFQILPATSEPSLRAPVVSAMTGLAGVPQGGAGIVTVANPPATLQGWTLAVNGQTAIVQTLTGDSITFTLPAGLAPGPAVVALQNRSGVAGFRIAMQVDAPPAVITGFTGTAGREITTASPARPGELLTIFATNVRETDAAAVRVTIGGIHHPVQHMTTGQNGVTQIRVMLSAALRENSPCTIQEGTRLSDAVVLPVRPAASE